MCVYERPSGSGERQAIMPICSHARHLSLPPCPQTLFPLGNCYFLLALEIKSWNYYPNIMPIYPYYARHISLPQCRHVISSPKLSFFLMPSYFQIYANTLSCQVYIFNSNVVTRYFHSDIVCSLICCEHIFAFLCDPCELETNLVRHKKSPQKPWCCLMM